MKAQILSIILVIFLSSCIQKRSNTVSFGLLNGPSAIGMVKSLDELTVYNSKIINYEKKDNPQQIRALLQSGNINMAIIPMTLAYHMIDNKIPIKIAAITGWGNLFLLSRDSIHHFSNLKNTCISVPGEAQTPDLVSRFLIDHYDLNGSVSLNYTYSSPILLMSALAIGKVNYAVLPEPLASIAISKDSSILRAINLADVWKDETKIPLVQSVLVINETFYKKNKVWLKTYLKEVEKNTTYIIQHPVEALKSAKEHELLPQSIHNENIIKYSQLDYQQGKKIADIITSYLKIFYHLDDDFNINSYIIME